ncbi:hypothetical protein ES703_68844 [subsurface metagenome]
MVAELLVVAGKTEDVIDTEGDGAEHIALQRQPVPVANDHLHHRLNALLPQKQAASQAGHAHDGRLVIGDVHRIAAAAEQFTFLSYNLGAGTFRRSSFRGHGKFAARQYSFQSRSGFHLYLL